ncbi:hypothetical protein V8F06_010073 [Rhypophila decipiens]
MAGHQVHTARRVAPRQQPPTSYTTPPGPQQTGTIAGCSLWAVVNTGDTCATLADAFGIPVSQFLAWNPAVSSDCVNNFWGGYSYCVRTCPTTTISTASTRPTTSASVTVTADPSPAGPTHSGIPCQCVGFHTVQSGDTCETVPALYGIFLATFLSMNPAVSADCAENFWLGSSYCVRVTGEDECPVPSTSSEVPVTTAGPTPASPTFPNIDCHCNAFYKLRAEDTCESVMDRFDVEPQDFFAWNPEVAQNCTFNFYVGYSYCVGIGDTCSMAPSFTGTGVNTATDYSYVSDGTRATENPRPTATGFPPEPLQSGTPENCQEYYQAADIDTCLSIVHRFSDQMDQEQFHEWNPAVGKDCDGLYVNHHYCVLAPIDIGTLPNATTQYTIALLHTTYSGAASGCPVLVPAATSAGCDDLEEVFSVAPSNVEAWNTGVDCDGTQTLTPDLLYCIGDPTEAPGPLPTPPPAGNLDGPQPQQAGIVEDCLSYWFVGTTDTCELIAEIHDVTEAQLISWNPVLDSDCSGLESGNFICVEGEGEGTPVSSSSSSSSSSTSSSTTTSTTTSQPPSTPTPTQAGMASGCTYFYRVRSGDNCWDISVAAGISLQTLYTLNPGLGTECASLWPDYFICLATSETRPTPTTITSGPPVNPTPQPVQAGIAPNCQRYYLVRGGDSCWDISVAISVPLNTFLSWNPALGQDCGGLWGAYYVCIGTGPPATTISSGPPLPT